MPNNSAQFLAVQHVYVGDIIRFLLTAFSGSLLLLGCHAITTFVADELLHRQPGIGKIAGALSILSFLIMPLNGWLIGGWFGAISLTVFWLIVSTPVVGIATAYRATSFTRITANPFYRAIVGGLFLFVLTLVNWWSHG